MCLQGPRKRPGGFGVPVDSRPATVRPKRFSTVNEDKCERLCLQTPNTKEHATEVNSSHLLALFLQPFSHDGLQPLCLSHTIFLSLTTHSSISQAHFSFSMDMQISPLLHSITPARTTCSTFIRLTEVANSTANGNIGLTT